jgi:PAS domain S-box-containing protein
MKSVIRILHLEDDPRDAELISSELKAEGIVSEIVRVETEKEFLSALNQDRYDLILADYSLPSYDGMSAMESARKKRPDIPFIFVSGAIGEELAISALTKGAIDYVLKNNLKRLIPAVKRALQEVEEIILRKQAEDKLRDSETKFRKIFESSYDGIFLFDIKNKKVTMCNQAFLDMLGYTADEFKNLHLRDVHAKKELPIILKQIKLFQEWKTGVRTNVMYRKKDGSIFFADLSPSLLELAGEKYILVICKDVTEHKRMEEELRQDKLSLEQKNTALTELIEHLERAKNQIKEDIVLNIEESIIPLLKKLRLNDESQKYIDAILSHLTKLTSSFGRKLVQNSARLSPREIEICNLIKSGMTTKDISDLLYVSTQTIEKHRQHVRKKLDIAGKDENLATYLNKL